MLTTPQTTPAPQVRRSKSSGLRVTSHPLPPQWRQRSRNQKQKPLPLFIRILLFLQHTSSWVALGAIAVSLVLYGLHSRTQQAWNQQYQELQSLQRYERSVIGINEALKDEIAESSNGQSETLVPLTPEYNIYLEPATVAQPTPSAPEKQNPMTPELDRPIGY